MGQNRVMGALVIFIGVAILLNIIGLGSLVGPILLLGLALLFIRRHHPVLGALIGVIGISTLFQHLFHFDIVGFAVSLFLVLIGYRLLMGDRFDRRKDKKARKRKKDKEKEPIDLELDKDGDWIDQEMEHLNKTSENKTTEEQPFEKTESNIRSALIGDFHLMNHTFELEDMTIKHGIGDVKIDLTKAIIPEGETVLIVNAWVGDVDIYVPYDLSLSVSASVTIGDLDILSDKQGGFQRHVSLKSKDYDTSPRRVKLILSLLIGDIDVRTL